MYHSALMATYDWQPDDFTRGGLWDAKGRRYPHTKTSIAVCGMGIIVEEAGFMLSVVLRVSPV